MATLSFTGTAEPAASDSSATPSPWPVSTAGCRPRATARSSSSETAISLRAASICDCAFGIVGELVGVHPELERERDQPLLGAVVEVALEPLALLLAGLDHALARALELLQLRLELDLQAPVLERDPRRRADRLQQLRLIVERGVVDEGRQMSAVAVDHG